jgi:hypothetical protein
MPTSPAPVGAVKRIATEQFPVTGCVHVPPVPGKVPPLKVKCESECELELIVAFPDPPVDTGRITSFVAPIGTLPKFKEGEFTNASVRGEDVADDVPEVPLSLNFS